MDDALPERGRGQPRLEQEWHSRGSSRSREPSQTGLARAARGTVLLVPMPQPPVSPGPSPRTIRTAAGAVVAVPAGWVLLPPGDPGLTRRVKAAGDHWVVQEKHGRRMFSRGVWAPAETIDRIRAELAAERSTEGYARKQAQAARRRERDQEEYVEDFRAAVRAFLAFDARHQAMAGRLADAVAVHATPVGSGTVARTQRIPIERRAQAAVIAWMRHQTTAYDSMPIPRVKGKRREVRRLLAERSRALLDAYRRGLPVAAACPLARALATEAPTKPAADARAQSPDASRGPRPRRAS